MGRLQIVRREIVRGAQGARGLPGVGSSAWLPDTPYTVGSVVQAPDGSWLSADEEHTSGAAFDAQEATKWTAIDAKLGTLAEGHLATRFASKSVQDMIEAGRLEDSVLSNRFGAADIRLGASAFEASSTSLPNLAYISSAYPFWSLDKTTEESVSVGEREIPKSWAAFDVHLTGANAVANPAGGPVRLRVSWYQVGEDDAPFAATKSGSVTLIVGDQNVRKTIKVLSVLATDGLDTTKAHVFRVVRVAADAADTLDNDFRFFGIRLTPTAFVTFEPDVPEPPEDLTGRTFTQAHNASLAGLRVWHQSPPPPDDLDAVGYKYFPATDFATTQDFTASTWVGGKWAFVWANRRNYDDAWNKKPNPLMAPNVFIGNRLCRAVFTTKAKAMAADRAQVRHLLGMDTVDIEADWIAAGGVSADIVSEAAYRASPATYCTTEFTSGGTTYMVMVDKVVLPTPQLPGGSDPSENKGIVYDYEVGDSRTATEAQTHIENLAADCHGEGYQFLLYGNPLTANVQQYHGINSSNLPAIFDAVDYLEIKLWSKAKEGSIAASWAAQIALLGVMSTADWAKIVVGFELGTTPGTTLADAEWVRAKLTEVGSDHPTKVIFWRNYAQQGGAPNRLTNQKISTICFGSETPPP